MVFLLLFFVSVIHFIIALADVPHSVERRVRVCSTRTFSSADSTPQVPTNIHPPYPVPVILFPLLCQPHFPFPSRCQSRLKQEALDWMLGTEQGTAAVNKSIFTLTEQYAQKEGTYTSASIEEEAKVL